MSPSEKLELYDKIAQYYGFAGVAEALAYAIGMNLPPTPIPSMFNNPVYMSEDVKREINRPFPLNPTAKQGG